MTVATTEERAVLVPESPDEAAEAFGDGGGLTVMGGGTILMPLIAAGRLRPERVLLLSRAGLDYVRTEQGRLTIGAGTPISKLLDAADPLGTAAQHVGDREIRGQATIGGNLCAEGSGEFPRGDLQAPLIALGASVRSAGAGGEREEPVEEFLAAHEGRFVLEITASATAGRSAYAALRRPHTHHYTVLAVAGARANGSLRLAVTGVGPHAVRLASVEASGNPDDVLKDVDPQDDALASAWYRKKVLPGLVRQALSDLGDGA